MSKRTNKEYKDTLLDFSVLIQEQIKEDLNFWQHQDPPQAKGREMAYRSCLFTLNEALSKNALSLTDIGLGGYEVPELDADK